MPLSEFNVDVSLDDTGVEAYVVAVSREMSRALAQLTQAFADYTTSRSGDTWRTVITLEKETAVTFAFTPGTTTVPLASPSLIAKWGVTESQVAERFQAIASELLPRLAANMLSFDVTVTEASP